MESDAAQRREEESCSQYSGQVALKDEKIKTNEIAADSSTTTMDSIYITKESCVCKENYKDEISVVLSIIYGMVVVILAIVFKVTESITFKADLVSKEYQCILFSIAIFWLLMFKLHNFYYARKGINLEVVRSPHASNRWLKGVVALFGFAIIIKDSLEVIGVAEIRNPECEKRLVYFSNFILHSLFIIGQVILLFFYAKVHIQEIKCISRFGVMHIMATNLAVWVTVIADETNHALHVRPNNESDYITCYKNFTAFKGSLETHCTSPSAIEQYLNLPSSNESSDYFLYETEGLFSGSCSCQTIVCKVIRQAEKFLTPLLVEYCLVSSCLLYVLWSHIGMPTFHHKPVPKPSHKLYKSYKGVMIGALMLVATVIILTLLGTLDSGTELNFKSYYSENKYLLIYDCFLFAFNMCILFACTLGIYVYSIAKIKTKRTSVNLDIVLLFICVTGPLLVELFSVFSLFAGPESTKKPGWTMSLVSSLAEVVVSVIQVLFAVHGLNKEPGTKEIVINFEENNSRKVTMFYNKNTRERQLPREDQCVSEYKSTENENQTVATSLSNSERTASSGPPSFETSIRNASFDPNVSLPISRQYSGTRCSLPQPPSQIRIILRDIMLFLVMCNSCLYIFLSLNGTVFRVYPYAIEYFGDSAWTTLTSVTAPVSIFLRLHFAACFFEIWSYA